MAREFLGIAGAAIGSIWGPTGAQIGFMIGSAVGNAVDPPTIDGPRLGEAPVQTSRDGIPIPVVWGVHHVVGNIIQIGPINEITKKSGSKKTGKVKETRRKRTFAIGICRGPITGLLRVWENNKLIYDKRSGSTFPSADNTAFEASTTIYLGDDDQDPDSELETITGVGTTPAYRGLAYIVRPNFDTTDFGSSIPTYRFEVDVNTFAATSGEFGLISEGGSANRGYSCTQESYWPDPSFQHPFEDLSLSAITMSAVAKASVEPSSTYNRTAFSLRNYYGGTGISIRKSGVLYYFNAVIASQTAGAVLWQDILVLNNNPGWLWNHWYWVGTSYNANTGAGTLAVRNLSLGQSDYEYSVGSTGVIDWQPNAGGSSNSLCCWGCGSVDPAGTPVHVWQGHLSQVLINGSYHDLRDSSVQNNFSALDGVRNIGRYGTVPFGAKPLVYLPYGHPYVNYGTLNIGTHPGDFFLDEELFPNVAIPPIGTTYA